MAPRAGCSRLMALDLSWCSCLERVDGLEVSASLETVALLFCDRLTNVAPLHECATLRMVYLAGTPALMESTPLLRVSYDEEGPYWSCENIFIFICQLRLHVPWCMIPQ